MSLYPRFNSSNTFNPQDIVSYDETQNGQTIVSLDLSSFVSKSAPVFESELYLKEGVGLNLNGSKQSTAFTDEYKSDLEQNKTKLTSINYANNKTTFSEELDLTGATVSLNDNQISQSKITNLVTRLTDIDINLANINSNDTDILNLNNLTATHTTQLSAIETLNTTQDGSINLLQTDVENITMSVLEIQTDISNLEATDTQHDASLGELFGITSTLTNDVISLTNMDNDISTNLNTYKVSNDASIVSINGDITDIQSVDVTQNSRLDAIETLNTNQDGRLDAIETLNTTQDGRLDAVESKNVIQDASINLLETLTSSHSTDLSNLTSIQNANVANITTLQGENTTQSSQISTLETQMLTKHPTINNSNKLNVSYIGNGDVSNAKLSALNDVRTDVSIQNQINTINDSISGLDALQDLDLINIPILQTDVANLKAKDVTVDASLNALATDIATNVNAIGTNTSGIASNLASINTTNTNVSNNANSISVLNSNVSALVSADGIHDTQISDLQNSATVLQANIDLKQNLISISNKLNTTKIFDTVLNDSLNNILDTIDSNINNLNLNKQNNINSGNLLNSQYLDLTTTNLQYCDITAPLKAQLSNITSAINTLQNLTSNDTITTFQDIEDNFDTLQTTKLNKSVYDDTIAPEIVNINNAISTLQGLQDGDVVSFQNINNSITNLTNTKHPLINTNNKLNSSLLNRDDNLQYLDVSESIQTKLNSLDSDIATKQNVIDNANKLDATLLNLNNNLQYADFGSSVTAKFASLDSSISTLNVNDVSQATTNTNLQNSINTNASAITDLETFETAQGVTNSSVATSITNLEAFETAQGVTNTSVATSITNLEAFQTAQGVTNSSVATSITDLETFQTAQGVTNSSVATSITDLETFETAQGVTNTSVATSITDLETFQTAQGVTNTSVATSITDLETFQTAQGVTNSSVATSITDLETFQTAQGVTNTSVANSISTKNDIIDVNNKLSISNVDLTGSDLINMDYSDGSLTTKLNTLQTNIDNAVISGGGSSKTEIYGTTNYDDTVNLITHTYDEKNLFIDPLDDNLLLQLDLSINSVSNGKNYKQVLVINCLEFKSYVNTLNINGNTVEIKHRDGDTNINLAPIAGYSVINQTLDMTRIGDEWYVMSNIELFYNSVSNVPYDITLPVINLTGDANVNHEINSGAYSDPGATANDNLDGSLTGSIVVTGSVDHTTLGSYNLYYNVTDNAGNSALQKTRVVNVVDTTNPVVSLIGDAEITLNVGNTYTEQGATASDNSNESLTVVIGGDTVNTSVEGDYTVTYTATDSTGNTHQISRLIHIINIALTLQYSNPSTDILNLCSFETECDAFGLQTQYNFTLTGQASYLNGDYVFEGTSYAPDGGNNGIRCMLRPSQTMAGSNNSKFYESGKNGNTFTHTTHGSVQYTSHPYDANGDYTGASTNNGSINPAFYSQLCNDGNTYSGEYIEVQFPFYIEFSNIYLGGITSFNYQFFPDDTVLLGLKNDDTYDLLGRFTSTSINEIDYDITSTIKYKGFKFVFVKCGDAGNRKSVILDTIRCYGDIYT